MDTKELSKKVPLWSLLLVLLIVSGIVFSTLQFGIKTERTQQLRQQEQQQSLTQREQGASINASSADIMTIDDGGSGSLQCKPDHPTSDEEDNYCLPEAEAGDVHNCVDVDLTRTCAEAGTVCCVQRPVTSTNDVCHSYGGVCVSGIDECNGLSSRSNWSIKNDEDHLCDASSINGKTMCCMPPVDNIPVDPDQCGETANLASGHCANSCGENEKQIGNTSTCSLSGGICCAPGNSTTDPDDDTGDGSDGSDGSDDGNSNPQPSPDQNGGYSDLCKDSDTDDGHFTCTACAVVDGANDGTQYCYSDEGKMCMSQACSQDPNHKMFNQTCTPDKTSSEYVNLSEELKKCTVPETEGGYGFVYDPSCESSGGVCTGKGGGGCGYCQSKVDVLKLFDINEDGALDQKDADSVTACINAGFTSGDANAYPECKDVADEITTVQGLGGDPKQLDAGDLQVINEVLSKWKP